jgi:16S rRNA (uracil1498-N3)-methyltransferase
VGLLKRGDNRVEFSLVEPIEAREPGLHLHLLIALVKFDRFEWCLEKATELGVNEITPLIAARTDKALVAAAAKRHARWERIVLESAQQSRRLRPPQIGAATALETAYSASRAECKILLSERTDAPPIHDALGELVLRTETAVLASLAILHFALDA